MSYDDFLRHFGGRFASGMVRTQLVCLGCGEHIYTTAPEVKIKYASCGCGTRPGSPHKEAEDD